MTSPDIDPPESISTEVAAALEESSDAELRTIIHYAQRLLASHPSLTDEIESREGEELVRMEDHGAYTFVVVERPDETGENRGPFAYQVHWQPSVDDGEGQYRWHYLGRIESDA